MLQIVFSAEQQTDTQFIETAPDGSEKPGSDERTHTLPRPLSTEDGEVAISSQRVDLDKEDLEYPFVDLDAPNPGGITEGSGPDWQSLAG